MDEQYPYTESERSYEESYEDNLNKIMKSRNLWKEQYHKLSIEIMEAVNLPTDFVHFGTDHALEKIKDLMKTTHPTPNNIPTTQTLEKHTKSE